MHSDQRHEQSAERNPRDDRVYAVDPARPRRASDENEQEIKREESRAGAECSKTRESGDLWGHAETLNATEEAG